LCLENKLGTLCLQGPPGPEEVERLIAGDLKGALARIATTEDPSPPVQKLLDCIETLQGFNQAGLDHGGKLFLLLPCEVSEGAWTVAQLLIHKEGGGARRERSETEGCRLVLVSEFSELGWVRAEVLVAGREVRVRLLSGSGESAHRLREQMPLLVENLRKQGYSVGEAICDTLDPSQLKSSVLRELAGAESFSVMA
jgi:hypothetical protein